MIKQLAKKSILAAATAAAFACSTVTLVHAAGPSPDQFFQEQERISDGADVNAIEYGYPSVKTPAPSAAGVNKVQSRFFREQEQISDGADVNAIEHGYTSGKARVAQSAARADTLQTEFVEEQEQISDGADVNAIEHEFDSAKNQKGI
ncbi:MAG: hypothetical protein U1E63_09535 [Burkholderiales bacterium]